MSSIFDTQYIATYQPAQTINATNLNCPLPLLKLKQGLNQVAPGEFIYLITTDTNSPTDIARYCARANYTLAVQQEHQGSCHMLVCK